MAKSGDPNPYGLKLTLGLSVVQIIFAIAIAATTATKLDRLPASDFATQPNKYYGPDYGYCVLNLVSQTPAGRVCDFVYATVGFGIFFSLLELIPTLIALRKGAPFLHHVAISHSLFASFWWLVLAVAVNQRGKQANAVGYPEESTRNAVIGLTWTEAMFNFLVTLVAIWDLVRFHRYKKAKKLAATQSEKQFKETHTHTQVLGATPLA